MVMAPANTGRESNNNRAVKNTDQTNRFSRSQVIPGDRRLITVVRKLIAPKMDEIPAIWSEKIARSTAFPEWATPLLSGGYTVQPWKRHIWGTDQKRDYPVSKAPNHSRYNQEEN